MSDLSFVCRDPQNPVCLPANSGLYEFMGRSIYENVPALSYSLMKRWLELESVPSKMRWWLLDRWVQSKTEALLLGSALDSWVLEGIEGFKSKFACVPKDAPRKPTSIQRNAKKPSPESMHAIAWWDDFARINAGKAILDQEQMFVVEQMFANLFASRATEKGALFRECKKMTAVNLELFGGLPWKSEFDLFAPSTPDFADLKICRDASAPVFGRDFVTFGYGVQACVYLTMAQSLGHEKTRISFVCVEREAPFTVKAHRFNLANPLHNRFFKSMTERIAAASVRLMKAAEQDFEDDGDWVDLQIPEWAVRQSETQELLLP